MKVVIVGSTHAGVAAAIQILESHPETEVVIYEKNNNVSFLSCGIALYLEGMVDQLEDMFYETPEHLEELGAKVKINHDVLKVNSEQKKLTVLNLETNKIEVDTFDKLIMTAGSFVRVPPAIGVESDKVMLVKGYKQAVALHESAKDKHHIAIVGGGFIGVELAEAYANTDHKVTLIQGNKQLLNNYVDEEIADLVVETLREHGMTVQLNDRVNSFKNAPESDQVLIKSAQHTTSADLALVCTGFMANTELLYKQVAMDAKGTILTNEWMETSNPDILAAGDAAISHFNPTNESAFIPLATSAVRQGVIAGKNVFGYKQRYMGTQATTALRFFDYTLANTGLTFAQAKKAGINAGTVTYKGTYRPGFMPTNEEVSIKLIYSKDTRVILGAQFYSKYDLTQSANTISLAIQNKNTIDDLAFVDMLFNPHYDQPFNYLNLVAQLAMKQEDSAKN